MRPFSFTRRTSGSLAAALLLSAIAAQAARRPRYGGTLKVELGGRVATLDPAERPAALADQIAQDRLLAVIADGLVKLDSRGQPEAALAASWQHDARFEHWEFVLRPHTQFQDATPLTADAVVASLEAVHPSWHVSEPARATGAAGHAQASAPPNSIVIDFDQPRPDLPYTLAEPRNSILLRKTYGAVVGTGPFRITTWQPGTEAVLAANDGYWGGRPFLDTVDIEMGRSARDRMIDLDLDKADVVDVAPESAREVALRGVRISTSKPAELLTLVFLGSSAPGSDVRLRQGLAMAIDRASLVNFVLQKEGEPAGGLLPQWSSGYEFLFPVAPQAPEARRLISQISPAPALKLGYDSADPLERMVAERIVVNGEAAGISLSAQPLGGGNASEPAVDARIVRFRMPSPAPGVALRDVLRLLSPLAGADPALDAPLGDAADPESLYQRERAVVNTYRIVPLMYVPEITGLSARVRDWMPEGAGQWRLADVWLDGESE